MYRSVASRIAMVLMAEASPVLSGGALVVFVVAVVVVGVVVRGGG